MAQAEKQSMNSMLQNQTTAVEKGIDDSKAMKAMSQLNQTNKEEEEKRIARQKALAAVKVDKADIELICSELETTADVAELALRENDGKVVPALESLINTRK
ncbi:hypothetical protein SAMD00019534_043040 [Acytostelium subglobosum LB1]|uniref:hypothetical protein n=1 Tax=Acytostelium subglobosum LB1 TaxID=1410327 RepID=UPI000644BF62|nr:hypothetical protein SAMD00019534_043040 [Acytostelium subglobosum LB1]GAM21129.1 hypothetical protein SAMD00019534_043040 [Acytostelium subglobosum LB1]|eukprot:XP_012756263.1 hypothetical protein SAMD00019534_043040 [Acytostelium subglobosum LB1]